MKREKPITINSVTLLLKGGGGGGFQGFGGFDSSSFSDIFEDFFSDFGGSSSRRTSNRGNDLRYDVSISLEDAYKESEKNVNIQLTNLVNRVQAVGQQKVLNQ